MIARTKRQLFGRVALARLLQEDLLEDEEAYLLPVLRTHVLRVRVTIPAFPQKRSPWHQDVTDQTGPDGTYSPVALACWMPLVDATQENGTLEVIPGAYDAPYPHQQTEDGQVVHCTGEAPGYTAQDTPLPCGRCALFGSVFAASHAPQSDDTDTMDPGHVGEMPGVRGGRRHAYPLCVP